PDLETGDRRSYGDDPGLVVARVDPTDAVRGCGLGSGHDGPHGDEDRDTQERRAAPDRPPRALIHSLADDTGEPTPHRSRLPPHGHRPDPLTRSPGRGRRSPLV